MNQSTRKKNGKKSIGFYVRRTKLKIFKKFQRSLYNFLNIQGPDHNYEKFWDKNAISKVYCHDLKFYYFLHLVMSLITIYIYDVLTPKDAMY